MKRLTMFTRIQANYFAQQKARRELIARSNEALSCAKRAIFALHRDDILTAKSLVNKSSDLFKTSERVFKRFPSLAFEGSYKAALEEYAEALLFLSFCETGKLGAIDPRAMDCAVYLGGLSDTTGEMVRYAVRQVTLGNEKAVARVHEVVAMVIEFLLDLDLTGPLRTKFDQAKKNLGRLEDMMYDLTIRR